MSINEDFFEGLDNFVDETKRELVDSSLDALNIAYNGMCNCAPIWTGEYMQNMRVTTSSVPQAPIVLAKEFAENSRVPEKLSGAAAGALRALKIKEAFIFKRLNSGKNPDRIFAENTALHAMGVENGDAPAKQRYQIFKIGFDRLVTAWALKTKS